MEIQRYFTRGCKTYEDVFNTVKWKKINVNIVDYKTGTSLYNANDLEFPENYSQNACEIIAKMYFRKNGVPSDTGAETSLKQVVMRMVNFWVMSMIDEGIIEDKPRKKENNPANIIRDELAYMLIHQMWAPNSPQWFNTGLMHAYGIAGEPNGMMYYDPNKGEVIESNDSYTRTQASACFIVGLKDSLLGEQGLMDNLTTASRLFKYGSGIGSNWSDIRGVGEKLSSGGKSSGLLSFQKVFDRNAGAIKSGGTTRRAAVMEMLDLDHPEIMDFVTWKAKEEKKVADLGKMGYDTNIAGEAYETVSGQNVNNSVVIPDEFMRKIESGDSDAKWTLHGRIDSSVDHDINAQDLWNAIATSANECGDPGVMFTDNINAWNTCPNSGKIKSSNPCFTGDMKLLTVNGYKRFDELVDQEVDIINKDGVVSHSKVWCSGEKETITLHLNNGKCIKCTGNHIFMDDHGNEVEAYAILDHFIKMYNSDEKVQVIKISDNGLQKVYDFTEPLSHWGVVEGCIVHNCGEYLFLDDTACNLASINIMKFYNIDKKKFDFDGYIHAITVIQFALEASIHWGQFPTKQIAYNTYHYRTTGLGLTNMGALLMALGIPYDSESARDIFALLCSIMTARSYVTSGNIASMVGPFSEYKKNEKEMLNVINNHAGECYYLIDRAVHDCDENNKNSIFNLFTSKDISRIYDIWHSAKMLGEKYGYRNAQVTVLAPTGTIAFAMDCDSTSSEPFFAHKAFKKVVDGSYIEIVNRMIPVGLKTLGYSDNDIKDIVDYIMNGDGKIEGAPHLKEEHLPVFDTANRCGSGTRFISPESHVRMSAAIVPHISGGLSKTVNMPSDTTVEDIKNIYMLAWKLGCKGITIYRDGSKVMQPLNTTVNDVKSADDLDNMTYDELLKFTKALVKKIDMEEAEVKNSKTDNNVFKNDAEIITRRRIERERLPYEPKCIKNAVKMNGNTYHITRSFYEDGRLGEIFATVGKQGDTVKGLMEVMCILISKSLQYGIPAEVISNILRNTEFGPNGMVRNHPYIKSASSIPDLLSKFIDMSCGNYKYCQVKPDVKVTDNNHDDSIDTINETSDDEVVYDELVYDKVCSECGCTRMIKAGTCYYCAQCGASTGCS